MAMSNKPRVNHRLLPHSPMSMRDKSIIDESHPMIILKEKVICSLNQNIWMSYSNDHFFYKTMCLLWATNFEVSPQASHAFLHFQGLSPLEMYQPHILGLSPEWVSIPACYYPIHIFTSMYVIVRLCLMSSNGTESTNQSPNTMLIHFMDSHPCHAMSPCIMQCNVSLHVYVLPHM